MIRDVRSAKTSVRIGEPLEVALDSLAIDNRPIVRTRCLIADRELLEKLAAIDRLSEREIELSMPSSTPSF